MKPNRVSSAVLAFLTISSSSLAQDVDADHDALSVVVELRESDSPVVSSKTILVEQSRSPDELDEVNSRSRRRQEEAIYIEFIRRHSVHSSAFVVLDSYFEDSFFCYDALPLPEGDLTTLCVMPSSRNEEPSIERSLLHFGEVYYIGFDDGMMALESLALRLEFADQSAIWRQNGGWSCPRNTGPVV